MERARLSLLAFVCCAACLLGWPSAMFGEESGQASGSPSSSLEGPLVIQGSPVEGEQLLAQEQAVLSSPQAVAEREASRTEFEGLNPEQAADLAGKAFPALIAETAGGPPALPNGLTITGYPSDNSMQVLDEGKHVLLESSQPLAVSADGGMYEPIDLSPLEAGGAYRPKKALDPVRIPKDLADGAALESTGVSLTPVSDESGTPLPASTGVLDGAGVFYGDSQDSQAAGSDVDTFVKPSLYGLMVETLLRSERSPSRLFFKVGLPAGATLSQQTGSGPVRVDDAGEPIALISAPEARDANGSMIPLSVTLSGDVVVIDVNRPDDVRYPIEVDPTVSEFNKESVREWSFYTEYPSVFTGTNYYLSPEEKGSEGPEYGLEDIVSNSVGAGQFAFFYHKTQGESRIYKFEADTKYEGFAGSKFENVLGIFNVHSAKSEGLASWIENYGWTRSTLCAEAGCAVGTVTHGTNDETEVFYKQDAREAGPYEEGKSKMQRGLVYINQEKGPSATFVANEKWVKPAHEYVPISLSALDPGLGVSLVEWDSSTEPGWKPSSFSGNCLGAQCQECYSETCGGSALAVNAAGLPEGEDAVEATVKDPVGLTATAKTTVKVDNAAPYGLTLSGLPAGNEISYARYLLKVSATDGAGSTPSSGIASIALAIDGKEVGSPRGSCSHGPCTATGEWTINGEEYIAGKHTIAVTATDGAGNQAKSEFYLVIHSAESQAAGPGSVELASGALALSATDVAVSSPGATLTVRRSYNSRHLTAGSEGPLGPQWSGLSIGGAESLTKLPTGSIVLTAGSGRQSLFTKEGATFLAPTGDASLTLKEVSTTKYTLTDQAGNVTTFTEPEGGSGTLFTPSLWEEAGGVHSVKYTFRTVGGITEPTQALAPVAAGVSCTSLVRGCRALTFKYATSTTATGEAPSEWGTYNGRLSEVVFVAYNPTTKAMQETAVSDYSYDAQGRLRAVWDPRVSPALKTTYGYDAEGHVTAVAPPAQQPWLFTYGMISGDTTTGRLMSVTRPNATSTLGPGLAPVNSEAPKLSPVSPVEGTELSVTNGTWSNAAGAYGYQWEDCESSGAKCSKILGAINPTYTARYSDEGHTLRVQVTATSSGGSSVVETAASTLVPYKIFPPTYSLSFGSSGSGSGQFNDPQYVAVGKSRSGEEVYVTDKFNNRVEVFDTSGHYLRQFGHSGTEGGAFKEPAGVAADREEDEYVWVADSGNKRMEWFINGGAYFRSATTHASGKLGGMSVSATGSSQYVANGGANAIERFGTSLLSEEYLGSFGVEGVGNGQFKQPAAVAWGSSAVYVADTANNRVEKLKAEGTYITKFGEAGTGPGQFKGPKGVAVGPLGEVWAVDTGNDRMEEFCGTVVSGLCISGSGEYKYNTQAGEPPEPALNKEEEKKYEECLATGESPVNCEKLYPHGVPKAGAGQMNLPTGIAIDAKADIFTVDSGDNRVEKWEVGRAPANPSLPPANPPNPGTSSVETIDYQVPVSGSGAPYQLSGAEAEKWAQKDDPVEGTAIFPADEPMGWPAKDYKRATVFYRDDRDRTVNVASPGGAISTNEYNATDDTVRSLSADNRVAALKEGSKSTEVSQQLDMQSTYNSEGTELLSNLGPKHAVRLANGKEVQARSHTVYSYDEGAPAEGGPYRMVTKLTQGAQIEGESEQDVRTSTTSYSGQSNLGWKLREPTSTTTDPAGLKITHTTLYEEATGNVLETGMPKSGGAESAHNAKTVYYSTGANAKYPSCGEHAEWANLPCETLPAKQPETSGLPALPVATTVYNLWDEPTVTTSTSGSATRTSTSTYDEAGRLTSTETTSTVGTALPKVSYEYDKESGALKKQSTTVEGKTQSLVSAYNKLGQLTSYTDASGNISTFEYETERDARLKKLNDGKGTQTYSYNETTGALSQVADSAAGTYTGTYDVEGKLIGEGYPNGMSAIYTYDAANEPVGLVYKKETHCSENCEWYKDSVAPSIHGQWLSQSSTLGAQLYTYDEAGRLTKTQETPAGKGCTTRTYAYDEDTNRTSLTTYVPNSKGECSTEGGVVQKHSYDEADRLTDTGTSYEAFGNIVGLSAANAGGSELVSSFYVDNEVASQEQAGQRIGYALDPAGRIAETISTGKVTATVTDHYAGAASTPAWTGEASGQYERNIPGVTGGLGAIQHNGESPVLQVANLHGDIVATASDSETATGLASTIKEATEYGVPATEAPPKYSWLGSHELPTELPSGVVAMGVRSYVPELGRFLQTDPVPGGSANAYAYTYGDPVDSSDLSGALTQGAPSSALVGYMHETSAEAAAEQAAINAAARAEAERKAAEAEAAFARLTALDSGMAEEYEEEWWEEEGEYGAEYASYHNGSKPVGEEAHVEEGQLVQPLNTTEASGEKEGQRESVVPLCQVGADKQEQPDASGGACSRYAHWWSKITKTIWRGVKTVARWVNESYYNPDVNWEPAPWIRTFRELPRYDYGVPPIE